MSINRNRTLLNKVEDRRTYRILWLKEAYPLYYDEGWHYWKNCGTYWSSKGSRSYKKKQILTHQVRMYRTWKHNRRTKWK